MALLNLVALPNCLQLCATHQGHEWAPRPHYISIHPSLSKVHLTVDNSSQMWALCSMQATLSCKKKQQKGAGRRRDHDPCRPSLPSLAKLPWEGDCRLPGWAGGWGSLGTACDCWGVCALCSLGTGPL